MVSMFRRATDDGMIKGLVEMDACNAENMTMTTARVIFTAVDRLLLTTFACGWLCARNCGEDPRKRHVRCE